MSNQQFLLYFAIAIAVGFGLYSLINKMLDGALFDDGGFLITCGEGVLAVTAFIFALFFKNDGDLFITLSIAVVALFAVVNFFRFKKKHRNIIVSILLGLIISFCGYFAGILIMVASSGSGMKQNTAAKKYQESKEEELEWANQFAPSHGYRDADEWAKDNGFYNASDAYDKGFFNGKLGQ